ncbi:MAG TPA: hypothetical protein VGN71_05820 [Solirubrobacteraceae bacterium]|jgi:hypothetical protein|nr:hypothetical protein [Solirubrobacteraceae bacterium]
MAGGAGVAVIPWYATVFRGDRLEAVVNEIAPVALRYGATEYEVLRSREDRYRFRQSATFERKIDFERYWYGTEFAAFRAEYASWYQVPIVYEWYDRTVRGALEPETVAVNAE